MTTSPSTLHDVAGRLQLCLPRLPIGQSPDTLIADLYLDSMDTVELLCTIHEEFGVRLTESDFHPAQTVGGMLAAIARQSTN